MSIIFHCNSIGLFLPIVFLNPLRYDPKSDSWSTVAPLSVPRDAVAVCPLGDKLYVVGGYDGHTYLNTVESYDAQRNEWKEVFKLKYSNYYISGFKKNILKYIFGINCILFSRPSQDLLVKFIVCALFIP